MRLYILNLGLLFSFTAWANGDQIKEAPANLLDQDKLDLIFFWRKLMMRLF